MLEDIEGDGLITIGAGFVVGVYLVLNGVRTEVLRIRPLGDVDERAQVPSQLVEVILVVEETIESEGRQFGEPIGVVSVVEVSEFIGPDHARLTDGKRSTMRESMSSHLSQAEMVEKRRRPSSDRQNSLLSSTPGPHRHATAQKSGSKVPRQEISLLFICSSVIPKAPKMFPSQ